MYYSFNPPVLLLTTWNIWCWHETIKVPFFIIQVFGSHFFPIAAVSSQVLLCDTVWIYEHIYTVSQRIYDICALATAALTVYFIPFLVPSVQRSSSFPTWVVFLSSGPPVARPGGWVKADKTPKYSVKHGRPLPRGGSLQCLLGNYGNNSAVRGEARGPGMMRSGRGAWDGWSGGGGSGAEGSRWGGWVSLVAIP